MESDANVTVPTWNSRCSVLQPLSALQIEDALLKIQTVVAADLSVHSQDDLDAIADEMNNRPRASLDWHSPLQVYGEILAAHAHRSTSTLQ